MDPSSLVFVAIIGVWAAYLVPQWLRRREQLAESRERDRDSAGVRVLAPRRRGIRPAHPASAGSVLGATTRPVTSAPAPVSASPSASRPARPVRAVRPPRTVHQVVARAAARRRARVLLLLLGTNLCWWAAVAVTGLPWPSALPAGLLLVTDLVALRAAARRRARPSTPARPAVRPVASVQPAIRVDPAAVQSVRPGAARPAAAVPAAGTWVPVPVPPPVYTLKPVVHRPDPAGWPPDRTASGAVPAPPAAVEEAPPPLDLDEVLERRRAVNL